MRRLALPILVLSVAAAGCGAGDEPREAQAAAADGPAPASDVGPSNGGAVNAVPADSGPDAPPTDAAPRETSSSDDPPPPARVGAGRPAGDLARDTTWSRYRRVSGPDAVPRIDRLVISSGPGEGGTWFDLEASGAAGRLVALSLLVGSLGFLEGDSLDAGRYLTHHEEETLEWVDARTGLALLPGAGLTQLLPAGKGGDPWPERLTFLGRTFAREPAGARPVGLPRQADRVLTLDPDVRVGTGRHVRDDGTGLHDTGGKPGRDYHYVELTPADYREMMAAGFNQFRVPVSHLPRVLGEPVFVLSLGGYREFPDLPFRGNYLGAVMYMDEPAARCYVAGDFHEMSDPGLAAARTRDLTAERLASAGPYGAGHMAVKMTESGCDYGPIVQANYPVWEAVPSAIWYALEGGVPGFCWQARLDPAKLARESREHLGVEFPDDIDACIDFHLAILRGAARHFDRPWGVSHYGQSVPAAADPLFPRAYDAGSTYFWLWTTDGGHHVPYARKLSLVRELRAHERESPRAASARELTRTGADTAIVLPWGYGFDDYFFGAASRHREGQLWGSRSMRLDGRNAAGVTHRDVLAAAMREAVPLLGRGEPYDVLFLRDGEPVTGYARVRRIGLDARVTDGA